MTDPFFSIRLEQPGDCPAIDLLNDAAFGPGRFARTAYRLREGVPHDPALSFVALTDDRLMGSVRLTPIAIGGDDALLLGPLAVNPEVSGRGIGRRLVRVAVEEAAALGHRLVLLVGDAPYYAPLGFELVTPGAITLPGPVDPRRLLAARLGDSAHDIKGEARSIRGR
ncbi:GNAT family N-acetyltransferase [Amorphus orientalis]|uniref:N-acetyltransferase YhbS n=1 Tax=Amorphus orientalis TaxID=649198 RepID=A0AAE3VKW3_9HYPH|nr:N-acetyltransferase [Amorphus orientalis]MDQ0313892.1 putative N-acetyltransferase YhbS [Amorphus orientalis]